MGGTQIDPNLHEMILVINKGPQFLEIFRKYEQQMFYFNTHRRIAKYQHDFAEYFRPPVGKRARVKSA